MYMTRRRRGAPRLRDTSALGYAAGAAGATAFANDVKADLGSVCEGLWVPELGRTIATGVSQWDDQKNSHNWLQSNTSRQPTVVSGPNSRDAFNFDGSMQMYLSSLGLAEGSNAGWMVMVRLTDATPAVSAYVAMFSSDGPNNASVSTGIVAASGGTWAINGIVDSNPDAPDNITCGAQGTDWVFMEAHRLSTGGKAYQGGTEYSAAGSDGLGGGANSDWAGLGSDNNQASPSNMLEGDIAAVVALNADISAAQRAAVRGRFADYYAYTFA